MVQSILFLLLGFLSAVLLALMVAPMVWRRAVLLTQRRIEASVPLSLNELRAEKDQVRAEAAVAIRRLEIKNKTLNETSVAQKSEISKRLEDIRQLNEENDDRAETIAGLEGDIRSLKADIDGLEDKNSDLSSKFSDACDQIEVKIAENDHLARLYDEASLVSSNRQIDLVARDTQIEKLSSDIDALKGRRDESEAQVRELSAELKVSERALQLGEKKIDGLEKKLEKMMAALSDSEDKLDRREKELARLKEKIKQTDGTGSDLRERLQESERQRARLQARLSRKSMEDAVTHKDDAELAQMVVQLEDDKAQLEARLKKIVAENRRLKTESAKDTPVPNGADSGAEQRENAELRMQINHLAAEIVNLTALLDGPNSEISEIIRDGNGRGGAVDRAASIADRVRALREAALAGQRTTRV